MVFVGTVGENPVEQLVLRRMFAARKEVFADLLKWDVPVLGGQYEIDQFDNAGAIYLIVTGPDGCHKASARLLPTVYPHILGSLFPELCSGEVPCGPRIFEITRFCLDRHQSAVERRLARNRLVTALVSFALEHGIETYTGVAEIGWLQQILAFGWDCRPLGEPRLAGCSLVGALSISLTRTTPSLLADNGIWEPEQMHQADIPEAA